MVSTLYLEQLLSGVMCQKIRLKMLFRNPSSFPLQVQDFVSGCIQTIECLEYRSRAISIAIGKYELRCVGPDGKEESSCAEVLPEYRYILGQDLKNWMKLEFPNEKPAFLFDSTERSATVSADVHQEVLAERDNLKKELMKKEEDCEKLLRDKKANERDFDALMDKVADPCKLKLSERRSYLNMIAVLLKFIPDDFPKYCEDSSYSKPSKLINQIVYDYYVDEGEKFHGLSNSNLYKKFKEAREYFESKDSRFIRK